jgi:hypothetical protein
MPVPKYHAAQNGASHTNTDIDDDDTASSFDQAVPPTMLSLRGDGYGGGGAGGQYRSLRHRLHAPDHRIESHNYEPDESEVWRACTCGILFFILFGF